MSENLGFKKVVYTEEDGDGNIKTKAIKGNVIWRDDQFVDIYQEHRAIRLHKDKIQQVKDVCEPHKYNCVAKVSEAKGVAETVSL